MTCGGRLDPGRVWRSRETAKRSDLAGWPSTATALRIRASFGAAPASGVHAVGLPVAFALAGAKADEREVLLGMLDADPNLVAAHPNQKLMADKNYYGKAFEGALADAEVELLRPARNGEKPRPATGTSNRFGRSSSRSITRSRPNSTSNATAADHRGVTSVLQRILALTAAICTTTNSQPTLRSLLHCSRSCQVTVVRVASSPVGALPFGRSREGAVWRCRAPTLMYATSPWVGHLASCRLRCHFQRRQTMIAHSEPVEAGETLSCASTAPATSWGATAPTWRG